MFQGENAQSTMTKSDSWRYHDRENKPRRAHSYPTVDPEDHEILDELPTELNTTNHAHFLDVQKDKLTVKYVGKANHAHDVGSVQANRPLPSRLLLYYFEVTVLDAGTRGCIAVGLADKHFQLNRQPGWESNSFGYHAEDGRKFQAGSGGEPYGPVYTANDIIGCGVNYDTQDVFFTKNGKYLGVAFKKAVALLTLFPTIGLHSPNEIVTVNFGQQPFKFDFEAMIMDVRERKMRAVAEVPMHVSITNALIRSYLLHYGYESTLACFDTSCGFSSGEPQFGLHERREIRKQILEGEIDEALDSVNESFPGLLDTSPRAVFYLRCQQFIEMIRESNITEAVEFAQNSLSEYGRGDRAPFNTEDLNTLQEVVGLVAYEDPLTCPLSDYLDISQREKVADIVNAAVLAQFSLPAHSTLERLLQQLTASHWALREENGCKGEIYKLEI